MKKIVMCCWVLVLGSILGVMLGCNKPDVPPQDDNPPVVVAEDRVYSGTAVSVRDSYVAEAVVRPDGTFQVEVLIDYGDSIIDTVVMYQGEYTLLDGKYNVDKLSVEWGDAIGDTKAYQTREELSGMTYFTLSSVVIMDDYIFLNEFDGLIIAEKNTDKTVPELVYSYCLAESSYAGYEFRITKGAGEKSLLAQIDKNYGSFIEVYSDGRILQYDLKTFVRRIYSVSGIDYQTTGIYNAVIEMYGGTKINIRVLVDEPYQLEVWERELCPVGTSLDDFLLDNHGSSRPFWIYGEEEDGVIMSGDITADMVTGFNSGTAGVREIIYEYTHEGFKVKTASMVRFYDPDNIRALEEYSFYYDDQRFDREIELNADTSKMAVGYIFDNGEYQQVSFGSEGLTVSGLDTSVAGIQTVTLTYKGLTNSYVFCVYDPSAVTEIYASADDRRYDNIIFAGFYGEELVFDEYSTLYFHNIGRGTPREVELDLALIKTYCPGFDESNIKTISGDEEDALYDALQVKKLPEGIYLLEIPFEVNIGAQTLKYKQRIYLVIESVK